MWTGVPRSGVEWWGLERIASSFENSWRTMVVGEMLFEMWTRVRSLERIRFSFENSWRTMVVGGNGSADDLLHLQWDLSMNAMTGGS